MLRTEPSKAQGWLTLTKPELIVQCALRGIELNGTKATLVNRLRQRDAQISGAAASSPPPAAAASASLPPTNPASRKRSASTNASTLSNPLNEASKRQKIDMNAARRSTISQSGATSRPIVAAVAASIFAPPVHLAAAATSTSASVSVSAPGALPNFDPHERRQLPHESSLRSDVRIRIERALSQRLFLISSRVLSPMSREYNVLGATGNVYTVRISHRPTCTCPDFACGNLCKHILFVMYRVLRVGRNGGADSDHLSTYSPLLYQRAYLGRELHDIFSCSTEVKDRVLADAGVRQAFKAITGEPVDLPRVPSGSVAGGGDGVERSLTGHTRAAVTAETDCAICFESLADRSSLVWCRASCGQNLHAACMQQWCRTKSRTSDLVECPYCRTRWIDSSLNNVNGDQQRRGYLNLASHSAAHANEYNPYIDDTYSRYWRDQLYGSRGSRNRNRHWQDEDPDEDYTSASDAASEFEDE